MAEDKESKTEEATSKKVRETQEKGQFANSRELTSAFVLLAAITSFSFTGQEATLKMMSAWRYIITHSHAIPITVNGMYNFMEWVMTQMLSIMLPILLSIMVAGVIANLLQTGGLNFSSSPLKPKFSKINPMKGFSRIFSKNSISELMKSLFKVGVLTFIGYMTIKNHMDEIPPLMDFSVGQILLFIGDIMIEIMIQALIFMVILSSADMSFQIFQHGEELKMSKEEVKQERKETDGNPQLKQRIRTTQLEMARKRMMAAVPEADVIVTNPTHISIALKYDRDQNQAPIVVAKGADNIAAKIREIAKANDVPLVENKPLARTLYKTVEIGQVVPANLFRAIAEILAHVYKLKSKTFL
jgi:flagellar biosynthetic protein FlhB